ncbi:hypothetical protein OIE62_11030 [Streptomyces scopuliridis]|uniref:Cobyrinic acid a,c-diamide synthase n=2 Tax=Streptomyces scopuliridis TaxID=452529 RepID=A0A2T7T5P9_9ACTN|nr:hypothetical protein [Streptomyces scopuliridis]PVE10473.1 hypothetical protein Y717_31640 [Streptomyces scopuliridis RB72]WSB38825.1 hypothetical protein OG949_29575 [Streptomyces scopuliridis]WSC03267.1 hypothetical protein OG835_30365 [Streptomyces scopuliridis]WSC10853.1 hypothetical protein OIE62_11030 [Streptomyces scopuliridis]
MSLPGADELFRTTGGMALQSSSPADRRRNANGEPRVPAPAGESDPSGDAAGAASSTAVEEHSAAGTDAQAPSRSRTADAEQAASAVKGRRPQEAASASSAGQGQGQGQPGAAGPQGGQQRRRGRGANRRPSGRERHDEKITVYVSAEELMDLEHARLVLRGEHGLAVDRGRIVREAVAVVLADLESRGDASILVRRLRGR